MEKIKTNCAREKFRIIISKPAVAQALAWEFGVDYKVVGKLMGWTKGNAWNYVFAPPSSGVLPWFKRMCQTRAIEKAQQLFPTIAIDRKEKDET